jgi:DNA-binding beta-propeller fold protein YncE
MFAGYLSNILIYDIENLKTYQAMNTTLMNKLLIACLLGLLFSFTQDKTSERIIFTSDKMYPEGISFDDKRGLVYLSSLTQGKISSVDSKGVCKTVCDDPKLISTVGIKYNNATGKLYACNGDMGMSSKSTDATKMTLAQVAIIDVKGGKLEDIIDFSGLVPGNHLLNDLTLDDEGNVYVTDSYGHVVFKADKNKNKSVFSKSDLLKPDSNTLGLNGIAYNKEGYLLLAKSGEGSLLKVSLKDPSKVNKVKLPEPLFWTDGIYFINEKELVAVRNRFSKTVFLKSDDHWETATIVKEEKATDVMPTTAVVSKGNVYVINSRLSDLRPDPTKAVSKEFVIDVYKTK